MMLMDSLHYKKEEYNYSRYRKYSSFSPQREKPHRHHQTYYPYIPQQDPVHYIGL
jgi:hypothetical protein